MNFSSTFERVVLISALRYKFKAANSRRALTMFVGEREVALCDQPQTRCVVLRMKV